MGADLIGFHIQSHCNNFLQTVDRVMESRIDWEHFSVSRLEHVTSVRPFPISVSLPEEEQSDHEKQIHEVAYIERSALHEEPRRGSDFHGHRRRPRRLHQGNSGTVSGDRAVSGTISRLIRVSSRFVQIGAPSRTHIKRYHDLLAEVDAEAERINWRFQTGKWKPIVLLTRQHSHKEIQPYYRAADLCLVTSLHDGMNLVAKEFLAARQDERGVLILSRFTGAARELLDALLVNPYDIDQTAEAIHAALEMNPEEKEARMQRMRRMVREHNIYRWAGNLMAELCEVRLGASSEEGPEKLRVGASA